MTKQDNDGKVPAVTETQVAEPPAFSPAYWDKAPRQQIPPATVVSANTLPNGAKEFILDNGAKLSRPSKDIRQLILVGTQVQVEVVNTGGGQIVTGMFVPQVQAWAWRMSSQELADYCREVTEEVNRQRMQVRLAMTAHLKASMLTVLAKYVTMTPEELDPLAEDLAVHAVISLDEGPQ